MAERAKPEIEDRGAVIIFHHLRDAGETGEGAVQIPTARPLAQANAPGGLREVAGAEAWELGAIAAKEDERLFLAGD